MNRKNVYAMLVLTLLTGTAACDQEDGTNAEELQPEQVEQPVQQGLPEGVMDPLVMQKMTEVRAIREQLRPIQQEALQDEALAEQLAAVQAKVEAAMREEDDGTIERMEQLQTDMQQAQAAGDQERMQQLMLQAQGLQQEMQALQAKVLERPEIRRPVEEFETAHRARMMEINPEAGALLDRMRELIESLSR